MISCRKQHSQDLADKMGLLGDYARLYAAADVSSLAQGTKMPVTKPTKY